MCVVSMVNDHYWDKWRPTWPTQPPYNPNEPFIAPEPKYPTPEEIQEMLKKLNPAPPPPTAEEIEEFRRLLERAREYDKRMNQQGCDTTDKKAALKALAEFWGINIDFIDGD